MATSTVTTLAAVEGFLQRRHCSFFDGMSHSQTHAQRMPLFDPASAEPLAQVELADLQAMAPDAPVQLRALQ